MESARIAEPRYSNTQPVPPAYADLGQQRQNDVFGGHARLQRAIHLHFESLRWPLQQALRGKHVLHFTGPDAERQRAKCSVRGRVAVSAHDRHPRLRQTQLRHDHVHDALALAVDALQRDAELLAVGFQLIELFGGDLVDDGQ